MWTHPRTHAERGERKPLLAVPASIIRNAVFDLAAHARYGFDPRIAQAGASRMATKACSKALLLRSFRQRKERDLRAPRFPRWARRPAIDSSRANRVNKRPVRLAVTGLHGLPINIRWSSFGSRASSCVSQHCRNPCMCLAHVPKLSNPVRQYYPILALKLSQYGGAIRRLAAKNRGHVNVPKGYIIRHLASIFR